MSRFSDGEMGVWPAENQPAISEKISRAIAQVERDEGIPEDQLRVRLAEKRAAWLAERSK